MVEIMRYRLRYTRGQVTWTAEPASYFRDSAGVAFGSDQLFLQPRKGAPLPDLVFHHPYSKIGLRARFYKEGEKMQHEVLVEGPRGQATANLDR
jgi:hypothetical protein